MKRSIIIELSFKKMLFEEAEGSKNQGKLSGLWTKEIITDKKISFQKNSDYKFEKWNPNGMTSKANN